MLVLVADRGRVRITHMNGFNNATWTVHARHRYKRYQADLTTTGFVTGLAGQKSQKLFSAFSRLPPVIDTGSSSSNLQ